MKLRRKKTGIFAGFSRLVGGLNGRDRDCKNEGNDNGGRDNRRDHRPIVVTFYSERLPLRVLVAFAISHQLTLRNLDPRAFSYSASPSAPVSFKRRRMASA